MNTSALIIFVLAGALSAANAVVFWSGSPNPWPAPGEAEALEQALRATARVSALWFAAHLAFAAIGLAQGQSRVMFTLAKGCWMALAAAMGVYALVLGRLASGGDADGGAPTLLGAPGLAVHFIAFAAVYAVALMLLMFPEDRAPSKPMRLAKLIGTVLILGVFGAGLAGSAFASPPIWEAGAALAALLAAFIANLYFGLRPPRAQ